MNRRLTVLDLAERRGEDGHRVLTLGRVSLPAMFNGVFIRRLDACRLLASASAWELMAALFGAGRIPWILAR